MKDRPSRTAQLVAIGRALATRPNGERLDPFAPALLAPALGTLPRGLVPQALRKTVEGISDVASLGFVRHQKLRTLAIDAVVERALSEGVEQVVLLGAGLDARAYRLEGVRDATVFEVDHPSTQNLKRERAHRLTPKARSLVYVPCIFGADRISDVLLASGFDRDQGSVWVWEGVTMYLTREAIRLSLTDVAEVSTAGSKIAITYLAAADAGVRLTQLITGKVFDLAFDEPFTPPISSGILVELGGKKFTLESDTGTKEWAAAHGDRSLLRGIAYTERLAVLERA